MFHARETFTPVTCSSHSAFFLWILLQNCRNEKICKKRKKTHKTSSLYLLHMFKSIYNKFCFTIFQFLVFLRYIYCERNGNSFISMVMRCKTGQFYSEEMKRCIKALQCPQWLWRDDYNEQESQFNFEHNRWYLKKIRIRIIKILLKENIHLINNLYVLTYVCIHK